MATLKSRPPVPPRPQKKGRWSCTTKKGRGKLTKDDKISELDKHVTCTDLDPVISKLEKEIDTLKKEAVAAGEKVVQKLVDEMLEVAVEREQDLRALRKKFGVEKKPVNWYKESVGDSSYNPTQILCFNSQSQSIKPLHFSLHFLFRRIIL